LNHLALSQLVTELFSSCFEEEWCVSFVMFCLVESGSESDDIVLFLEVLLQFCAALSNVWLGFLEFFGVISL
jgi:hypothetical protein